MSAVWAFGKDGSNGQSLAGGSNFVFKTKRLAEGLRRSHIWKG